MDLPAAAGHLPIADVLAEAQREGKGVPRTAVAALAWSDRGCRERHYSRETFRQAGIQPTFRTLAAQNCAV